MRKRAVSLTNWKRYLDYENNPKLIPFIKSRGNEVFWQISQNVWKYNGRGLSSLTMIIHENAPYAINIPKKEYFETFKADKSTISFVNTLINLDNTEIVVVDERNNPIEISDPKDFLTTLVEAYNGSMNEFLAESKKLAKARSIKKIMDW